MAKVNEQIVWVRPLRAAYDGHYSARYGIIYEVRTAGAIIQRHLHPNKHSRYWWRRAPRRLPTSLPNLTFTAF